MNPQIVQLEGDVVIDSVNEQSLIYPEVDMKPFQCKIGADLKESLGDRRGLSTLIAMIGKGQGAA